MIATMQRSPKTLFLPRSQRIHAMGVLLAEVGGRALVGPEGRLDDLQADKTTDGRDQERACNHEEPVGTDVNVVTGINQLRGLGRDAG
jgi:hypothetical protein